MRRSLPVLNDGPDALDLVEIPIPCEVPWDSMPGDEQVRHCGQCRQNVYNVSAFTRAEAMKLLRTRACLRIYRRPDSTVITSDCRERLRAARKRGLLMFMGVLLVVLWAEASAMVVGWMALRRVRAASVMGEPRVAAIVPAPAPPPAPTRAPFVTAGVPVLPLLGKPSPRMGEVAIPDRAVKGRIRVKAPRAE